MATVSSASRASSLKDSGYVRSSKYIGFDLVLEDQCNYCRSHGRDSKYQSCSSFRVFLNRN